MAQSDDLGTNMAVSIEKKLYKKWNLETEAEWRTRDHLKAVDRYSLGMQIGGTPMPWLKMSAGWTFIYDHNKRISKYEEGDKDVVRGFVEEGDRKNRRVFWGVRLRTHISATLNHRLGNWRFSFRERWQYTYRFRRIAVGRYNYFYKKSDGVEHVFGAKGKNELRSRLKIEYKKKGTALKPYASIETFNAWDLEETRFTLGTEYDFNKWNALGMFYRYILMKDRDYDDPNRHVIGLEYSLKLK